jgi:hypothetical protein
MRPASRKLTGIVITAVSLGRQHLSPALGLMRAYKRPASGHEAPIRRPSRLQILYAHGEMYGLRSGT